MKSKSKKRSSNSCLYICCANIISDEHQYRWWIFHHRDQQTNGQISNTAEYRYSNLSSLPNSKMLFLSSDDKLSSEPELVGCCCENFVCIDGLECRTSCKDGCDDSDELLEATMVRRSRSSGPYRATRQTTTVPSTRIQTTDMPAQQLYTTHASVCTSWTLPMNMHIYQIICECNSKLDYSVSTNLCQLTNVTNDTNCTNCITSAMMEVKKLLL